MSINPKADLQDVEAWIELVKKGQTNKITDFFNRLAIPYYLLTGKTNEEWLEVLQFVKKQLEEEIIFFDNLKIKYSKNGTT